MTSISAKVTGTQITLQVNGPLTCGMVGLPIEFTFDETWDGLKKTAVFRASGLTKDRLNIEKHTTVPWEVMEKTGCRLLIGVYGTKEDGSLAIPTVWGTTDPIEPGADPSGDESADPTPPVWGQLQKQIDDMGNTIVKSVNGTTPDENGNVQIETGGGGSTAGAVLYTKQTLTAAQQTQARQNIGAADAATIGDISAALTELHNYAEALKGGADV